MTDLSKLEYFAGRAMQGFIAKYSLNADLGTENFTVIAEAAVAAAKALIDTIEKEKRNAKATAA